eukprot:CAMPEP_0182510012 /NCGR_PEP_ID=MMETSP1321-20130603/27851_1 /TAXON_ID=91990 /ORGANISM="Bolidomonas sp., Strain RCC1657" /LENGTH=210 /DNA_ID=CAMNT_0024716401 /DNA_START=62 /DNA_END=690 /DNA_ORIENTATION=+
MLLLLSLVVVIGTLYNAETFLEHLGYVHIDTLESLESQQGAVINNGKSDPNSSNNNHNYDKNDDKNDNMKDNAPPPNDTNNDTSDTKDTSDNIKKATPTPTPKPTPSPVSQTQNVDTNTNTDTENTDNSNDEPKLLFKFYDSTPSRPTPPFSSFPNSDVPPSSFPSNSWQSDVVYLNHFIQESLQLIDRTLKGLGQEYNNTNLFKLTKLP